MRLLEGALLLLCAVPLQAEPAGLPAELKEIAAEVAEAHPGAQLVKLSAVIGPDGRAARCPKEGGPSRYGGYAMVFQTPAGGQWTLLECGPREPVLAFLSPQKTFEQRFIGVEEALAALKKEGLSLSPGGVLEAELRLPAAGTGFPPGVPFWVFHSVEGYYFVNARTAELQTPGAAKAAPKTAAPARAKPNKAVKSPRSD